MVIVENSKMVPGRQSPNAIHALRASAPNTTSGNLPKASATSSERCTSSNGREKSARKSSAEKEASLNYKCGIEKDPVSIIRATSAPANAGSGPLTPVPVRTGRQRERGRSAHSGGGGWRGGRRAWYAARRGIRDVRGHYGQSRWSPTTGSPTAPAWIDPSRWGFGPPPSGTAFRMYPVKVDRPSGTPNMFMMHFTSPGELLAIPCWDGVPPGSKGSCYAVHFATGHYYYVNNANVHDPFN